MTVPPTKNGGFSLDTWRRPVCASVAAQGKGLKLVAVCRVFSETCGSRVSGFHAFGAAGAQILAAKERIEHIEVRLFSTLCDLCVLSRLILLPLVTTAIMF
jgi:hypothetical protein